MRKYFISCLITFSVVTLCSCTTNNQEQKINTTYTNESTTPTSTPIERLTSTTPNVITDQSPKATVSTSPTISAFSRLI
ncbi:hypothetical protein P5G65_22725 [Paenibacillus chondroitinus]|uniref:Uncharacterized protein n=1 Tax=Paenibacillus chondroitinus TaxID=59842 RepID=A0ABU6DIB2_9BACL|nr:MULTISPECIES: hypothetical protein [Paenibacillus]MCY9662647.1 hypothetical protein [Paenibacillus anseongense]MEB4796728.1 hypothetical protein [Paenibacillus chondroitinus]